MVTVFRPKEGFARNPLHDGKVRNAWCICYSGKKVKQCCGLFPYAREDYAEAYTELKKGNLDMARFLFSKIKEKDDKSVAIDEHQQHQEQKSSDTI
jgi:hypothetical protein